MLSSHSLRALVDLSARAVRDRSTLATRSLPAPEILLPCSAHALSMLCARPTHALRVLRPCSAHALSL
eukprot:682221-Lingulodinium_polyedra.AAC.1